MKAKFPILIVSFQDPHCALSPAAVVPHSSDPHLPPGALPAHLPAAAASGRADTGRGQLCGSSGRNRLVRGSQ